MTVFSVQRFVENQINRRGFSDEDDYAIRVANAYASAPTGVSRFSLEAAIHRIRTDFFRRNRSCNRTEWEGQLASSIHSRFPKKKEVDGPSASTEVQRAIPSARARLQKGGRRGIQPLLAEFKRVVEARAIDAYWVSRKSGKLMPRPETVAQTQLAVFAQGVIGKAGFTLREFQSGTGYVDVGVSFGSVLHLVELKILSNKFRGPSQLASYMKNENRREGWLVQVDVRDSEEQTELPAKLEKPEGTIRVLAINVNPLAPSKKEE